MEGINPDDFRNCKIHELYISLDRNKTEVDTSITACSGQERCFNGSLLVSSTEEDRYGLKSSIMDEFKQVTSSS